MPLVVLTESIGSSTEGYDVRLGPLEFVTPADTVSETIGDGLEVVGAALTASDRRPRPLKLKLPVRGYDRNDDPTEAGLRLRRQVRQLLDNAKWRLQGFYFLWDVDPDLDGWLLVGGADLSENDPGISFGDFEMELSDVYIVGRPGTHRPGKRAYIGDRRTGLVPRDSRRTLYATDFGSTILPLEPLILPGDSIDLVTSGNRPVSSTTTGTLRSARRMWRTCSAIDGEILTYLPDPAVLPDRDRYFLLDDLGSVRAWDLSTAATYPPDPASYTAERDTSPDVYYGWERVCGDVLSPDHPLALENGLARVIWLSGGNGVAVEGWMNPDLNFRRLGFVEFAAAREQRIVELTPERGIIEWRAGSLCLRAILQRGWWGPRFEAYDDSGTAARLVWHPTGSGTLTVTTDSPSWVRKIVRATGGTSMFWASGTNDEDITPGTDNVTFQRTGGPLPRSTIVAQLAPETGLDAEHLARLSLIDAQQIPVLVGRR